MRLRRRDEQGRLVLGLLLAVWASCDSSSSPPSPDRALLDSPPRLESRSFGEVRPPDQGRSDRPAASYGEVADSSRWAGFNLATVNPLAHGYLGVGFDGRHAAQWRGPQRDGRPL